MKESHFRSWLKALSWRLNGSLITMVIVYIMTGTLHFALYVGSLEFICKIVFFYVHERIWMLIPLGLSNAWDREVS